MKLEASDLVSQLDGSFVKVVVALDVDAEPPIVEEGGFNDEGGKCGELRTHELDKPAGKYVGVGLNRDNGVGEEWMEE